MYHSPFSFYLLPLSLTYLPVYPQLDKEQAYKHTLKTLFMNTYACVNPLHTINTDFSCEKQKSLRMATPKAPNILQNVHRPIENVNHIHLKR